MSVDVEIGSSVLKNSVGWESRLENEWPIDVETEFLIQTLSWWLWCLVAIKDVPFLVETVVCFPLCNSLAFNILTSPNTEDVLVVNILDVSIGVSVELPPVAVSSNKLVVSTISVALDVERLVVLSRSDSSRLPVEVEFLEGSSIWSLDNDVSVVDDLDVLS